jgi:predicted YcjX-like family ATPase
VRRILDRDVFAEARADGRALDLPTAMPLAAEVVPEPREPGNDGRPPTCNRAQSGHPPTEPCSQGEQMDLPRVDRLPLWLRGRRTAILGTSMSGKSTFLTSLLDWITRADGTVEESLIGRAVWHVERLPPFEHDGGFPLRLYREDCLGNQIWPDKTIAASEFRVRFWRQSEGLRGLLDPYVVEEHAFVDLPGERVADFSMANRGYAEWSDAILEEIRSKRPYQAHARDYLALVDGADALAEAEVVRAYKTVLARFARRLLPLVTPSTFLVEEHGQYPKAGDPAPYEMSVEEHLERGICGLDASSQFAPLPASTRAANEELTHGFAQQYDQYRRRIVDPFATSFYDCDRLLILVDVAAILEGGPALYHSLRRSLRMAIDYLDPGLPGSQRLAGLVRRLLTGGRLGSTKVEEVALIATKADCVHRKDRANLTALLEQMTRDLFAEAVQRGWLTPRYFACAAVEATRSDDEYPYLKGWIARDPTVPDVLDYRRFPVSKLPPTWPAEDTWNPSTYRFAQVWPPKLNLLGDRPFPGINMDEVVELVGWGRLTTRPLRT